MNHKSKFSLLIPGYILVITLLILVTFFTNRTVTILSENVNSDYRKTLVIDAGHGGIDGGATSCSGVLESHINLDIALRLSNLAQLLGIKCVLIRDTDCSIHTAGDSIASKKVSDLKNRLHIINQTNTDLFVSIHQNYFHDGKYRGAQVFYNKLDSSKVFAEKMQSTFINTLNHDSRRSAKRGTGIYLLENSACPGALIECGFISNYEEDILLNSPDYQKKICCIIASECSKFLYNHSA